MIKIYSDGTAQNTRVFQADGSEIKDITKITWSIEGPHGEAKAVLEFELVQVEVFGENS